MSAPVGAVVIGRNEGKRLAACLESVLREGLRAVYVDSGSTDGSAKRARRHGVEVVELDAERPFTAARARNAGLRRLLELAPDTAFVQFVDADCALQPGWIAAAAEVLETRPRVAVVCGRRREERPHASLYNRLADLEWDTPVGEAEACGGDALIRAAALQEVGGFDETLIAGEEPELCLRLRRRRHGVLRLDREMTVHDADMHHLHQWWRRQVRAGHAYAESAWRHGREPERFRVRETGSALLWGLGLPALTASLVALYGALGLLALTPYGALWLRAWRGRSGTGRALYALACVAGKLPQLHGVFVFAWSVARGRHARLIEYKAVDARRHGS